MVCRKIGMRITPPAIVMKAGLLALALSLLVSCTPHYHHAHHAHHRHGYMREYHPARTYRQDKPIFKRTPIVRWRSGYERR
jgi:hypothetical protein